jgi:hypothetical protein
VRSCRLSLCVSAILNRYSQASYDLAYFFGVAEKFVELGLFEMPRV